MIDFSSLTMPHLLLGTPTRKHTGAQWIGLFFFFFLFPLKGLNVDMLWNQGFASNIFIIEIDI